MEQEDGCKVLNFLDVTIKNNKLGKYEFGVHGKNAITNVQVKKHSSHDPNIQTGIIKGFVNRAFTICGEKHIEEELQFLIDIIVVNGCVKSEVKRVIAQVRKRRMENTRTKGESETPLDTKSESTTITLPWIPGVSLKLRKVYKKAGYKTVLKSGNNLKNTICSNNKRTLPRNSYPGVYIVNCRCKTPYIGETKFKICSRGDQHRKNVIQSKIDYSGTTQHSQKCEQGIEWESLTTLKVENNKFDRKVGAGGGGGGHLKSNIMNVDRRKVG